MGTDGWLQTVLEQVCHDLKLVANLSPETENSLEVAAILESITSSAFSSRLTLSRSSESSF